ncbi:hypothetical protein PMAYCL1PPCAC_13869, partial [Pristionchus mayeri]
LLPRITKDEVRKTVAEINSSKSTHDISANRVLELVIIAFLKMPGNHKLSNIKERIGKLMQFFQNLFSENQAQFPLLEGIHEYLRSHPMSFGPIAEDVGTNNRTRKGICFRC